ncbi:MAG: glycosyltransferase [Pseudomonadota bacterium]
MKLDVIATEFPCPSETFAGNDVRSLVRQGVDVEVRNLRPAIGEALVYLQNWGLESLKVTHLTYVTFLLSIYRIVRHPLLHCYIFYWMFQCKICKPVHVLKTLSLIPRSVEIYLEIAQRKTEVLHIFWGHYPSIVGALVQRFAPKIKVTMFLGSYDLLVQYPGSVHVANRAHHLFTHARVNVPDIRSLGITNKELSVVYRGIDRYRDIGGRPEKKRFSVVTAGRLIPEKGVEDCLAVVQRLRDDWPQVHLTIAGSGPLEKLLRSQIQELELAGNVTLLGHLSHNVLFELLHQQHVMLLMSWLDAERLPNVVKEAMLCSTVCVTTDTAGIEELVETEKNGFIVDQHDIAAAVNCIDRVFSGEVRESELINAAHETLRSRFDLDKNMARYIEVWSHNTSNESI